MAESKDGADGATPTGPGAVWRRGCPWLAAGILIGIVLAFGPLLLLRLAIGSHRERTHNAVPTHTESGYRFPAVADISKVDAGCHFWHGYRTFDVPQDCLKDIFAALSPSERDHEPGAWIVLGNLTIQTRDGTTILVQLYSLEDDATGAFSAGPTFETRKYFRGGNTHELEAAMAKAYEMHLRGLAAGPHDAWPNARGNY
jgi:hypothetical protein